MYANKIQTQNLCINIATLAYRTIIALDFDLVKRKYKIVNKILYNETDL